MLRIGFVGDVMLGRGVGKAIADGAGPVELWDPDLRALAGSLDLVVCNLECCLSDRGAPTSLIEAKPFFFRGPTRAVAALQAINAGIAGVANNHILDFGEQAGADTVELLHAHGIATAGSELGSEVERIDADRFSIWPAANPTLTGRLAL